MSTLQYPHQKRILYCVGRNAIRVKNLGMWKLRTQFKLRTENVLQTCRESKKEVHRPGIEPGSVPWQGTILPLDHRCM
jgi:hypothetical protein